MIGKLAIHFTPRADRQVDEAGQWWRENRLKAPDAFTEALEEALDLISYQPHAGAIAQNVRLRNIRRIYLGRTGHYLYYRVRGRPPESIEVVAVWHARRGRAPRV